MYQAFMRFSRRATEIKAKRPERAQDIEALVAQAIDATAYLGDEGKLFKRCNPDAPTLANLETALDDIAAQNP